MKKAPMINVGATKKAVREARAAVNDILRAPHTDQSTKVAAPGVEGHLLGGQYHHQQLRAYAWQG